MEVALSYTRPLPQSLRRSTAPPLGQLVRDRPPPPLLQAKTFAKLRSTAQIEAEPSELHYSGFDLGQEYSKVLKLINISSEVMNIHVIPPQTKYFQTTYTKMQRLIPGLACTVTVHFLPDEWRYFYDCVRVHCQGEENLLIPVHAYPIIDDLCFPAHISFPPTLLGHCVSHTISLGCSCPVNFEFQLFVLEPHPAFCVQPVAGVIPARGKLDITVTFCPLQYDTCHSTLQLLVSQFNTKPFLCAVSGRCAPCWSISMPTEGRGRGGALTLPELPGPPRGPRGPPKPRLPRLKPRSPGKTVEPAPAGGPALDLHTPAGVAKMLMRGAHEDPPDHQGTGMQARQRREAAFMRAAQATCHAHLAGEGVPGHPGTPGTPATQERQTELFRHTKQIGGDGEQESQVSQPQLSEERTQREAGQAPDGPPAFSMSSLNQLPIRETPALSRCQQAARKVVLQCRMAHRLVCLRQLADGLQATSPSPEEQPAALLPHRVLPFSFPVFAVTAGDQVADRPGEVPAELPEVTVGVNAPFFKLQVPLHCQLMVYQPVSPWEAFTSYTPPGLARELRPGALHELLPMATLSPVSVEMEDKESSSLTFVAPEGLLRPPPAPTLRVFNPAPGLQTYKPTPKYLETENEFHLCPLPRYTIPGNNVQGMANTQRKFLDRREVIQGVMTWRNFMSGSLTGLSRLPTVTSDWAPRSSVDYDTDMLPITAPQPISCCPQGVAVSQDGIPEGPGVCLSTDMIRAEFLSDSSHLHTQHISRQQRLHLLEEHYRSKVNQVGSRVIGRLKQLTSPSHARAHTKGDLSEATPRTHTHTHAN